MATVTDDPLDKKVEMTNWEQVCALHFVLSALNPFWTVDSLTNIDLGSLHQLQVCKTDYLVTCSALSISAATIQVTLGGIVMYVDTV